MFMNEIQKRGGVPNLKGAAIGDGCWGTSVGTCAFTTGKSQQIQVEFFNGHGMFDQPLYSKINEACKNFTDEEVTMPECKASLKEMTEKIGYFDVYNIYDTCAGDTLSSIRTAMMQQEVTVDGVQVGKEQEQHDAHPQLSGAVNDYGWGRGRASSKWLAREDVQRALQEAAHLA